MSDKELMNHLNEKNIIAVEGVLVGGMERHEMEHAWLVNEGLLKKQAKEEAKGRIVRFHNKLMEWEGWLW